MPRQPPLGRQLLLLLELLSQLRREPSRLLRLHQPRLDHLRPHLVRHHRVSCRTLKRSPRLHQDLPRNRPSAHRLRPRVLRRRVLRPRVLRRRVLRRRVLRRRVLRRRVLRCWRQRLLQEQPRWSLPVPRRRRRLHPLVSLRWSPQPPQLAPRHSRLESVLSHSIAPRAKPCRGSQPRGQLRCRKTL